MNVSSGGLPADVRLSIVTYLSLPEVLRLGMAAKSMHDLWWPCCEEVSVVNFHPLEARFWLLSQNLSKIRRLSMHYWRSEEKYAKESHRIPDLLDKIEALTTLTNLQSLTTDMSLQYEKGPLFYRAYSALQNIMASLTQLQAIRWFSADAQDFNVGQLFSAHKRLTQFTTHSKYRIHGVARLTQVRDLTLRFCDEFDDQTLSEVCQLNQLQSLDLLYNEQITDEGFTKITNLTNLQRLVFHHAHWISATSLGHLQKLPKLASLSVHYSWESNEEEGKAAVPIIGQLTNLTQLTLNTPELDFGKLSKLTGLLELKVDQIQEHENEKYSTLSRLTRLELSSSIKLFNLPPSLLELEISSLDLDGDDVNALCNLENLRSLILRHSKFDVTDMSKKITKLSALRQLTVNPCPPKEFFPGLCALPNLASIFVDTIPEETISELAKLTQVLEMKYWIAYDRQLPRMVPFYVNFIGDRENFPKKNKAN